MSEITLKPVDHTALKVNQITIIVVSILAFVLNAPLLAAVVTGFMLVGTLLGLPGFVFIYRNLVKPAKLLKPEVLLDNPEPHRFAQGFGEPWHMQPSQPIIDKTAGTKPAKCV